VIRITPLAGETYGEFWPNGMGRTSQTIPPGLTTDLMFTRVASDGRIVGKGHEGAQGGHALYHNGTWHDLGECIGSNPCAFHPTTGEVYVSLPDRVRVFNRDAQFVRDIPGYVGSQGIRAVNPDGSMQTGDATYNSGLLTEYTDVAGLKIGQGHDGGGIAVESDGVKRTLVKGAIRFVRTNEINGQFAIYGWDTTQGYRIEASRADLLAVPADNTTPVPPPIVVPPVVDPPKPMPHPDIPDCKDLLDAAWAAHPDLVQLLLIASNDYEFAKKAGASEQELSTLGMRLSKAKGALCSVFATACGARDVRFGQRKKVSGTNYTRPDGIPCSTDVLMWKENGQIIDTLSDRGYGWLINWGDRQPVDQWVAPLPPVPDSGTTAPDPGTPNTQPPTPNPPPPATPGPDHSSTEVMVSLLLARVDALEARLKVLETKRKVSTSRVWGHAHEIDLPRASSR